MAKNEAPVMYLGQIRGSMWAKRRMLLQQQLDMLKKGSYDKSEMKRMRKEIIQKMNECQAEMNKCAEEAMEQNHKVMSTMLTSFILMDMICRAMDYIENTFKEITVGRKKDELVDFTKLCKIAAATANEVVVTIDKAGNEKISLAYANLEDDIGERLFNELLEYVEQYSKTPEGRKLFFGN